MKLSQLAAKPQLIEIVMDDEDTIRAFGEPLTFHTWDRQPLDIFIRLANVDANNQGSIIELVKTLILDESGQPVITGDVTLPTSVLMRAITRVTDLLGK